MKTDAELRELIRLHADQRKPRECVIGDEKALRTAAVEALPSLLDRLGDQAEELERLRKLLKEES